MKVAYLTQYDATDVKYWSGTGYNMAECLKGAGIDLSYIGPLKNQRHVANAAQYGINKYLLRKNDHPQRDPAFLQSYGREASGLLERDDADLVFAPGGLPLSYLKTDRPVVLWTDCTFANLLDYYPAWSNLSARSIRNGHDAERRALANCDLVIFSSQWAANSAVDDYGVDPAKTLMVAFGGNMPGEPSLGDLKAVVERRLDTLPKKLTLFCSGVNWRRKGMDIAAEVVGRVNAAGVAAELLIAGCSPPSGEATPSHVELLGFISKAQSEGVERLQSLYRDSHWFLCPTRADCTPMVLCEAASYGLPSLATNTGGIASLVTDGVNGWSLPADGSPAAWADRIVQVSRDPTAYRDLCLSAYRESVERLNWAAAGAKIKLALEGLLQRRRAA
jgi:glycosyltransferase involved in cell wall biosynthesis